MALLMFEGFEHFNPTQSGTAWQDIASAYPVYGLYSDISQVPTLANTSLGGKYVFATGTASLNAVFGYNRNYLGLPSVNTFVTGFAFNTQSVGFFRYILSTYDSSDGIQMGIAMNASGQLFLWRGSSANVIVTGTTHLTPNDWYFIELKVTIGSPGSYELHINENLEFSGAGTTQNTGLANVNRWGLCVGPNVTYNNGFDDWWLLDTTGPAPLNNFLGKCHVEQVLASVADGTPQWTPLAGSNVSQIQEANCDHDTTYNSTPTAGKIDMFLHNPLTVTPPVIYAVNTVLLARKDDVASKQIRTKMKSGATNNNGATYELKTNHSYIKDTYIVDPNTGVAWTKAGVDATSIGYESL